MRCGFLAAKNATNLSRYLAILIDKFHAIGDGDLQIRPEILMADHPNLMDGFGQQANCLGELSHP